MRRKGIIKYAFALALSFALAAFSGCVWLGEALSSLTPAETDLPLGSVLPTGQAEATGAPYSDTDNPVLLFINGFQRAYSSASKGLAAYAYDQAEGTAELVMLLMRDESRLCLVASTVGMLPERSAVGAFSGEVTGAYAGSGTLSKDGEFEFELKSGGKVKGSLSSAILKASVSGGSLTLYRNGTEYLLWFTDESGTGVLEVGGNKLRFVRSEKQLEHSPVYPEAEGLAGLSYAGN